MFRFFSRWIEAKFSWIALWFRGKGAEDESAGLSSGGSEARKEKAGWSLERVRERIDLVGERGRNECYGEEYAEGANGQAAAFVKVNAGVGEDSCSRARES